MMSTRTKLRNSVRNPGRRQLLIGAALHAATMVLLPAGASADGWVSEVLNLSPRRAGGPRPVAVTMAIGPAGKQLAIAGDDHVIQVWNLAGKRVIGRRVGHTDGVRALAYSPDRRMLASAGNDGRILFWNETSSRPVNELVNVGTAITTLVFSHDNALLASAGFGDPMRLFDVAAASQIEALRCPCHDMRALAFSPRDNVLAGAGRNGKVRFWEPRSGDVIRDLRPHHGRVRDLKFSPDGRYLASGGEDRMVWISTVDGEGTLALPEQPAKVMALAFVGDDQIAVGGSDNVIRIWNLQQRVETDRLVGHTGSITALVYAGNTLVSASYDTTVRIWRPNPHVADGAGGGSRAARSGVDEVR